MRTMGSLQTNDKVAIITGASSGIGLALARHLHSKGWRVAIFARRPEAGQKQASALDPTGETAIFEQCDVSSYSAQATAYKNVWAKWGRLDLVIPNAGAVDEVSWYNFGARGAGVDDIPPEPNTSCTDVHLKGVMYGTLLAQHFMRHNTPVAGGKIIATASILAEQPCPTFPEYCASEAGILHWVRTMAPLLEKKDNITINAVLMGAVATPVMPNFVKAFKPEHLTKPATICEAYDVFINDDSRTGEAVETVHDKLLWHETPAPSGKVTLRTRMVYDPWFAMMHGERSDLGPKWTLEGPPEGNTEDLGRADEFKVGFT